MDLAAIRDEAWDMAEDTATIDKDRFWPKAQMNLFINRIHRHIARETRCIKDATTPEVCLIASEPVNYLAYAAGTLDAMWAANPSSPLYQMDVCPYLFDIHPTILEIKEVKWVTKLWEVTKASVKKWQQNPIWEQDLGDAIEYATDLESKKIALNFRGQTADTLQLQVTRLPLNKMVKDADLPEFRDHYHDFFLNGVLWLMYSKPDAETFDMVKASTHKKAFEADIDEIKQAEIVLARQLNTNHSLGVFR
jgi:hypothetical protein